MNSINSTDFQMVTSLIKGSQMAPDFLSYGILLYSFQIFILSSSFECRNAQIQGFPLMTRNV